MTEEELSKSEFDNLQIKFVEEKTFNNEKRIFFLENKLKEMDKKIEKINSDHKNEIEEMKQNFQKLIEERFQQLKDENVQNDKKINSVEETKMDFVKIKNKWSGTDGQCCNNKCINANKPIGNCIKGNGFVNIINRDSQNMHGKLPNMRIYMHRKSPKYASKYAKFAKYAVKYAPKNS